jgi:hypothetical protein
MRAIRRYDKLTQVIFKFHASANRVLTCQFAILPE